MDLEKLNLLPYSNYELQVSAIIVSQGPSATLRITTEPASKLSRQDIPNINIYPSDRSATVIIDFDCQAQGGGSDFYLVYCPVKDCSGNGSKISLLNNSNVTQVTLKSLQPSTKYSLEFKLRRMGIIYKKDHVLMEFTTTNIS